MGHNVSQEAEALLVLLWRQGGKPQPNKGWTCGFESKGAKQLHAESPMPRENEVIWFVKVPGQKDSKYSDPYLTSGLYSPSSVSPSRLWSLRRCAILTSKVRNKTPVAMGKKGHLLLLVDFKGKSVQNREKLSKIPSLSR